MCFVYLRYNLASQIDVPWYSVPTVTFYTVLYVSTGSITVLLHQVLYFSLSHICKMVGFLKHNIHYTCMASPDVEMMCVLYCSLLYDHIAIIVNPPTHPQIAEINIT